MKLPMSGGFDMLRVCLAILAGVRIPIIVASSHSTSSRMRPLLVLTIRAGPFFHWRDFFHISGLTAMESLPVLRDLASPARLYRDGRVVVCDNPIEVVHCSDDLGGDPVPFRGHA